MLLMGFDRKRARVETVPTCLLRLRGGARATRVLRLLLRIGAPVDHCDVRILFFDKLPLAIQLEVSPSCHQLLFPNCPTASGAALRCNRLYSPIDRGARIIAYQLARQGG